MLTICGFRALRFLDTICPERLKSLSEATLVAQTQRCLRATTLRLGNCVACFFQNGSISSCTSADKLRKNSTWIKYKITYIHLYIQEINILITELPLFFPTFSLACHQVQEKNDARVVGLLFLIIWINKLILSACPCTNKRLFLKVQSHTTGLQVYIVYLTFCDLHISDAFGFSLLLWFLAFSPEYRSNGTSLL